MPVVNPLNNQTQQAFKRIELISRSVVEGFITGLHKSPFKGFAIEFAEHRPYVPGDDTKHLDHKILGKQDRYYIKQYEEDTALRATLILDVSRSMTYASGQHSKYDLGCFITGVMTYLLLQQQDSVGLVTCDDTIRQFLPPRSTRRHFNHIMTTLSEQAPVRMAADALPQEDTVGLGQSLHTLANKLKRRGLIVIMSDFFEPLEDIISALNHFSHRRHEVVVFQLLDRREVEFDFTDLTRFDGVEGLRRHMVDPIRLRKTYMERFEAHQHALRQACHNRRIDYVPFITDEPFDRSLAKYLLGRLRR